MQQFLRELCSGLFGRWEAELQGIALMIMLFGIYPLLLAVLHRPSLRGQLVMGEQTLFQIRRIANIYVSDCGE